MRNLWIGVAVVAVVVGIIFIRSNSSKRETSNTKSEEAAIIPLSSPTIMPETTELQIEDLKAGEGAEVKSGDTLTVHYKGTLLNGTQFDSSYDRGQPFEVKIGVGQVIQGWDKGILGMKVGGKRKLVIPSELGYGKAGAGNLIPPDATLVFEIELLEIR